MLGLLHLLSTPAAVGDNTGTLVVAGNLQVDGTTTTINSTTMTVDDLNITLASGAANAAAANGAGVTVEGASATLTYNSTPDAWSFNKNLGIGVTNPDARLSVTTDQQLIARLASSNTGITGVRLQGLDASANDAVFVDWFYDAENRQYGFGEGTASGSLPINSGIAQADVVINNGNVRITSENGLSALSVTTNPLTLGSLTSYNMALDSNEIQARNNAATSHLIINKLGGNVGIGQTSPAYPIDVKKTSGTFTAINIEAPSDTGFSYVFFSDSANAVGRITYDHSSDSMLFRSNGAEAVKINSAGNVGIGELSPDARLALKTPGNDEYAIRAGNTGGASGSVKGITKIGLDVSAPTLTHASAYIGVEQDGTSGYRASLTMGTRQTNADVAPTEAMRITSAGLVGLGTAIPAYNLHIHEVGSGGVWTMYSNDTTGSTSGNGVIVGIDSNEEFNIRVYENKPIDFWTNNSHRARITNVGELQLYSGVLDLSDLESPSLPASIESTGTFGNGGTYDSSLKEDGQLQYNAASHLFADNSTVISGYPSAWYKIDGGFNWGLGSTEVLTIDNSGNVGIGNSSPGTTKLRIAAPDTVANANKYGMFLDVNMSGSDVCTTDRTHRGLFIDVDSTASGGDTGNEHRIHGLSVDVRATGDSDLLYGSYSYAESQNGSGTITSVVGALGYAVADDTGTGRTTNLYGVQALAYAYNTGTGGSSNLYGTWSKALLTTSCDKNTATATGVYSEVELDDPGQAQTLNAAYAFQAQIDNDSVGNVSVTNSYLYYGNYQGTLPSGNVYGVYILDNVTNYFAGSLDVAGTKNFQIKHPVQSLANTHNLVHTVIEGPSADNMYNGMVRLVDGSATINIDTEFGMTQGTFVALNRNIRRSVTNEEGFTAVKCSLAGNILTITAESNTCTDEVFWMVIGQRQDEEIKASNKTDADGYLILEPEQVEHVRPVNDDPNDERSP